MMDETHGGRAFGYENQLIDANTFQPLDCISLLDEFHKLFQVIDQGCRGFVNKDELQDF